MVRVFNHTCKILADFYIWSLWSWSFPPPLFRWVPFVPRVPAVGVQRGEPGVLAGLRGVQADEGGQKGDGAEGTANIRHLCEGAGGQGGELSINKMLIVIIGQKYEIPGLDLPYMTIGHPKLGQDLWFMCLNSSEIRDYSGCLIRYYPWTNYGKNECFFVFFGQMMRNRNPDYM